MVDAHDGQGEGDELAPRHVLEALTVPELPYDFADRVMGALQVAPPIVVPPRRSAVPWVIAGCATVVALAATLLLLWALPRAPEPPVLVGLPPVAEPATPMALAVPTPIGVPRPAPALGHLVLTVEPRDATVRVDGESIAGPSPFVATNLAVGAHALSIEREGFESWTRTIDVPVGELDLPITLVAVAASATPATDASLRPTTRKPKPPVGLKDPFGARANDDRSGESSPDLMDPFAKAEPQRTATLRIGTNAGAGPARVFVDGKPVGTTPIGSLKVTPGQHQVTWKWPEGREVTQTITVHDRQVLLVKNG